MAHYCFLYVTVADRAQALSIGRVLVEERLAACVNIGGAIDSIYRWRGKIEQEQETTLIIKTAKRHIPALIKRVRELHSYDVPCIVAFDIIDGCPDYLQWLEDETKTS